MTEKSLIQKSISWALLAMIALYSIASVGNVSEFIHKYHEGWTGYALGTGFGLTLFVSAYIASIAKQPDTRRYALLVAGTFGMTSAGFQMSLYMDGGARWYVAFPLAFVPIVVGEIGLALLESSYSREHQIEHDTRESARLAVEIEQLNQRLFEATERGDMADKLRNQVLELQQQLTVLESRNFELLAQAHESQNLVELGQQQADELQNQAKNLQEQANEWQRRAEELQSQAKGMFTIDRVDELPSNIADKLNEVIGFVREHRIENQKDFCELTKMSRSTAQTYFNMAQTLGLIRFENSSTNAFVLNRTP